MAKLPNSLALFSKNLHTHVPVQEYCFCASKWTSTNEKKYRIIPVKYGVKNNWWRVNDETAGNSIINLGKMYLNTNGKTL